MFVQVNYFVWVTYKHEWDMLLLYYCLNLNNSKFPGLDKRDNQVDRSLGLNLDHDSRLRLQTLVSLISISIKHPVTNFKLTV